MTVSLIQHIVTLVVKLRAKIDVMLVITDAQFHSIKSELSNRTFISRLQYVEDFLKINSFSNDSGWK